MQGERGGGCVCKRVRGRGVQKSKEEEGGGVREREGAPRPGSSHGALATCSRAPGKAPIWMSRASAFPSVARKGLGHRGSEGMGGRLRLGRKRGEWVELGWGGGER